MKRRPKSNSTAETWKNLDPALKASLKRGLKEADKGQTTSHEEIWSLIKSKYITR